MKEYIAYEVVMEHSDKPKVKGYRLIDENYDTTYMDTEDIVKQVGYGRLKVKNMKITQQGVKVTGLKEAYENIYLKTPTHEERVAESIDKIASGIAKLSTLKIIKSLLD